jgi:MFS family permease
MTTKTTHTTLAWLVTLTASLFFFYQFLQMNFFNTINEQLREAYHLDALQLGQLFAMYFYANFLFLFPAGSLLDRYSPRKILMAAVALSTVGTFIFSISSVYWVASLGRFMVGASAAFCFLSCIRIASNWFPPHRMAFVTGVVVTMAMLGGLVAQTPFASLVNCLGDWRHALLVDTALGAVILLAVFFIVQDHPPDAKKTTVDHQQHLRELGLWRCIKLAALNPQNWLAGLYTALLNLPVFILGGLWGILYLTRVHQVTQEQASYATTIFFMGVILGSLCYGYLSDHLARRVLPMIIGAITSIAIICILMFSGSLPLWSLITLFFLTGFFTSSQVLTYPLIAELNPGYLSSTALSINSLCIMGSGFVIPAVFGWLMQWGKESSAQVYTADDFNRAMLMIPIAFVLGLIITFILRESYCQQAGEK